MSGPEDPLVWIEKAEEDYQMARYALRRKPPFTTTACFHAQQCAEKYLKALLVARKQTFPKVHDLQALSDLCNQIGILLPFAVDSLDRLTSHATRTRYPGENPTLEEAREALEIARAVRRFGRKFFGQR